ncbi:MAG: CBS domain-containing protein [Anaerolineae bacterium]|nr:CBS domain-containing protein [Anaerolineae bacterium]
MRLNQNFVNDIMKEDIIVLDLQESISNALWIMQATDSQWLPICDDDFHILGVISWVDILFHLPIFNTHKPIKVSQDNLKRQLVRDIMNQQVITAQPEMPLDVLLDILSKRHLVQNTSSSTAKSYISNVPVVQSNKLVGMVGYIDILRNILPGTTMVKDVLEKQQIPAVRMYHTIQEAHYLLHEHSQRYALVISEDDNPVGVISDLQILRYIRTLETGIEMKVQNVMTDIRYFSPISLSDNIEKAIHILSTPQLGLRAFPITENGKFISMISYVDILRYLLKTF